jgi:hypothetical protein
MKYPDLIDMIIKLPINEIIKYLNDSPNIFINVTISIFIVPGQLIKQVLAENYTPRLTGAFYKRTL